MTYDNKAILFPLGMRMNANRKKIPCYTHTINRCTVVRVNRNDTIDSSTVIKMTDLNEDTHFVNCIIYLEGDITGDEIVPFYDGGFHIKYIKDSYRSVGTESWKKAK